MNEQLIGDVVEELRLALVGRAWGKVFQLSNASLAVDFRTQGGRYLFVSVEPGRPRIHLISRSVRELEKSSLPPSQFTLILRKSLGGATLRALRKDCGERVVRFNFDVADAVGREHAASLVAQLTGRTANLFLLDAKDRIVAAMRPSRGEGQVEGEVYSPPQTRAAQPIAPREALGVSRAGFASISEALDAHYRRLETERAFDQRAGAASARIRQGIAKLEKLRDNLARDIEAHGDAEGHKRAGELLLANVGTAVRSGRTVRVTDFFAEGLPAVEFEIDENKSLQEEAARRFALYGKAKRAAQEIAERLKNVGAELAALETRRDELERIISTRDRDALAAFTGTPAGTVKSKTTRRSKKDEKNTGENLRGIRRYRSSDGYEILVGRGSRENDQLTFRIARSLDTWMHAADYPGSHVVVRARSRDEQVPHRTVIEAAQLAAHFSKAGKDSKVAVNYTQRKFVSKPKGAVPGLVYLSSFRTLLVEPREELERII
ncbi:MAG TPA: NFACT family protein [Pyrinomonadaceae bacterium]|nr:NFACT family protein [Pyrinomonadaceae bacterium]